MEHLCPKNWKLSTKEHPCYLVYGPLRRVTLHLPAFSVVLFIAESGLFVQDWYVPGGLTRNLKTLISMMDVACRHISAKNAGHRCGIKSTQMWNQSDARWNVHSTVRNDNNETLHNRHQRGDRYPIGIALKSTPQLIVAILRSSLCSLARRTSRVISESSEINKSVEHYSDSSRSASWGCAINHADTLFIEERTWFCSDHRIPCFRTRFVTVRVNQCKLPAKCTAISRSVRPTSSLLRPETGSWPKEQSDRTLVADNT